MVAEGVLYFLQRAQVEALFLAQAEAADARRANLQIAFDYASPFGAWIVSWQIRSSICTDGLTSSR